MYSVANGGNGDYLISVGQDKQMKQWDLRQAKAINTLKLSNEINFVSVTDGIAFHNFSKIIEKNERVELSKPNKQVALGLNDGSVTIYDLNQQKIVETLNLHE